MKNELEVARAEGQSIVDIKGMQNRICNLCVAAGGGAAAACMEAAVRARAGHTAPIPREREGRP